MRLLKRTWHPRQKSVKDFVCRLLLVFSMATVAPLSAAPLPSAISKIASAHKIQMDNVGIFIQPVDDNMPLLAHHADKFFNPASVAKLFTTLAAFDILGPKYTWKTTFKHDGSIKNGVLNGNLYLIGGGDPYITLERFLLFLHALRSRGLKKINGDLVIDESFFNLPPHDAAAFDGEPLRTYNTGAGAAMVSFSAQRVIVLPQDNAMRVFIEPPNDHFVIDNQLRGGEGPCRPWRRKISEHYHGDDNAMTLSIRGIFPPHCGEKGFYVRGLNHAAYAAGTFGALWRQLGGEWSGQWRSGASPPSAATIIDFASLPLAQILSAMNKYSNNVMARQVFLSLAAGAGEPPFSLATAQQVFNHWAKERNLTGGDFFMDNGSGLSRQTRVSAAQIAKLLRLIWASPMRAEIIASLPILGADGTLRERLTKHAAAGHFKTGSLANVKSIAGFMRDAKGRDLFFVCLLETASKKHAKQFQNDLIKWAFAGR